MFKELFETFFELTFLIIEAFVLIKIIEVVTY